MSKDLSGMTGLSDMGKTIGEQSGNAKSHLDSVAVPLSLLRIFTPRPTRSMMCLAKTLQI